MPSRIIILILILLAIDLYVFQGVRFLMHHKSMQTQRWLGIGFWSITLLSITPIVIAQFVDWQSWPKMLRTITFSMVVIIYLSKLFVLLFLILDDILRLIRWIGTWVGKKISTDQSNTTSPTIRISRIDFLVKLGFFVGAIPFVSMIYGMIGGAYDYKVRRVKLKIPSLPDGFEGFRFVQISDLHTGSFMSTDHLKTAVDLIMKEKPEAIFVTGDLVNNLHTEALPYRDIFSSMKAPLGVHSVFGNHDYGDYHKWESIEDKINNLQSLKAFQKEVGWNLLLNDHTFLERNGEKIGLIGVENWSSRMNFQKYGDMNASTKHMEPAAFNILLSHDPSHWDAEVTEKYRYINLTLSGHTHGMQFGVDIPGFKWSPVQYVYKQWADLYQKGSQYLYVNRGLGFLAYPGRVGILPEITVFELSKA
ncbi:MAG TPA: metallophosphoesterase [Bacteroidia bacterium]|nr:metallophosphoesterase [Bacteroidia bacterium]HNS12900.1 metallophosphoesterase [Bacteroidia bacterium]